MVKVVLKLFGPLRDIVGREDMLLTVPKPHTGDSAFDLLVANAPHLKVWKPSLRLAVNQEYTTFQHELQDGDEICFIPPVSGG